MNAMPDNPEQAREEMTKATLEFIRGGDMPQPHEDIFEQEARLERELEKAWDQVCGSEAILTFEDDVFGGEVRVSGFCVGEKGHQPATAHIYSSRSWLKPAEIIADALPNHEQRPF